MKHFPFTIIDLTHSLHEKIPTWDGSCGFHHTINTNYDLSQEYKFKKHDITMSEGIGTHMDAPAHCIPGGKTVDELLLSAKPCVVIDVSSKADDRYCISPEDIQEHETSHGQIVADSYVMLRTGWDRHWPTPEKYRNDLIFPSLSSDAAKALLERNIAGIAIDTLSPDRPDNGFPVHNLILGAGKIIVENAANLAELPPEGSFVLVAPIKIKNGTEAPIRLIGFKALSL